MIILLQYLIGAGFCTVFVISTVAIVLLFSGNQTEQFGKFDIQADDAITFDEFITSEFSHKTFNGSWWSSTELQWKNKVILY